MLNILGQAPLVTVIKMAYPYYSKIQYDWNITYLFPIYFCFHLLYDEFLTYWSHRIFSIGTFEGTVIWVFLYFYAKYYYHRPDLYKI